MARHPQKRRATRWDMAGVRRVVSGEWVHGVFRIRTMIHRGPLDSPPIGSIEAEGHPKTGWRYTAHTPTGYVSGVARTQRSAIQKVAILTR